jgi:hypothetical protein
MAFSKSKLGGTSKNVGISVTELDTSDNNHIIIPHKSVWKNNVIKLYQSPIRRVGMEMGIERQVQGMGSGYGDRSQGKNCQEWILLGYLYFHAHYHFSLMLEAIVLLI